MSRQGALNIDEIDPNLNGAGLQGRHRHGRFNIDICEGLLSACTAELKKLGVAPRRHHASPPCPAHWRFRWCCRPWRKSGRSMRWWRSAR
jgi:hypothetical protein